MTDELFAEWMQERAEVEASNDQTLKCLLETCEVMYFRCEDESADYKRSFKDFVDTFYDIVERRCSTK